MLVGFGEIGSGLKSPGFGQNLAAGLGVAYVAVKQRHQTQYQFVDRNLVAEALSPWSSDHDLYFYGTSLGGYCAAYYARPLAANFLALSPRIPAHLVTEKRLPIRYTSPGFKHKDIYEGTLPDLACRKVVLLDRHNSIDEFYLQTDLSLAFDAMEIHHIPHAGHYVPRALQISGCLKRVVVSFLLDETLPIEISEEETLSWQEERFNLQLRRKRFGHAFEHLEVLMKHLPYAKKDKLVRALNSALRAESSGAEDL